MFEWILKKIRKDNKGFTLVELVVVIAILAILAAIAIPRFGGFTAGAKEGAVEANHRTIVSAAQMYYANNKEWPADLNALTGEYLAESDFEKNGKSIPEGATYKIEKGENDGSCTITATFTSGETTKTWTWDSDNGFTRPGDEEPAGTGE